MAAWNIRDWTWQQHMSRARAEFGAHWPAHDDECTSELGMDGMGTFNMLERAGLNRDLRKDDVFLYFGDDDGQPTPREYALFKYTGDVGDDAVDDLHGPDDPNALAPRQGVELCALLVKVVVSFPINGPGGGTRTWVLGQSFSMARYLRRRYSLRCSRIDNTILDYLHPREHMLTDLWQAVRLHNVVALGCLRTLCDWDATIAPPIGMPDDVPVYWRPGCVHGLDSVKNSTKKQALLFRPDPRVRPCACSVPGCVRKIYDRGEDVMARCAKCERWYHDRCVKAAIDEDEFTALDVTWRGGQIAGPATRRTPNQSPALWKDCLRGISARVDPPVRSWERVAAAVAESRYWVEAEEEDGGALFREALHEFLKRGDEANVMPELSASEVDEAIAEVESGGGEVIGRACPLVCPFCDVLM